ncbi:glycoside hydrolase family 130 protein [Botrimarina sp.]|uniref:glycoside hydrolase family 130 protein n=1 Tax=Botrimarina sp. TaxID=2795802 RepID=UPI0032ED6771
MTSIHSKAAATDPARNGQTGSASPRGARPFPWQARPAGSSEIIWRYRDNPVLGRKPVGDIQGIYNSAVTPFGDGYAGVFRTEDYTRFPRLHVGWSNDGLDWTIEPKPIEFTNHPFDPAEYAYDPRVTAIDGEYVVQWCGGHNGPTISLARTKDFRSFERMENAFLPFNRNGVLFPRRINGNYYLLSRPSDDGHTPFGDVYLSESPNLVHWGRHRLVMRKGGEHTGQWWQRTKIGAGPVPIETPDGWLMIYHAVMDTCNGFVYSLGAALLDLDEPWRVLYRTNRHLLTPDADYEVSGHVPNVVFPVATLLDDTTGRLTIYYGAADTCTALAFAHLGELVDFTKANSTVF